jgi:hypothetical protein
MVSAEMTADLADRLGGSAARALLEWAEINGRTVSLPHRQWTAKGYTGAVLA